MSFRPYIDYSAALKTIQSKPGVWHRVLIAEKSICLTVASRLRSKGAVAKVFEHDDLFKVVTLWPNW